MRIVSSICLLCSLIWISSCGRQGSQEVGELVAWPEITHFDDLAFRVDGLVRVKDLDSVREILPKLREAGAQLRISSMPGNVANREEVSLIFNDLVSLTKNLEEEELDDVELSNLILGLHPVIEKLIEAAKMPHVHANEGVNSGFLFPVFGTDSKQVGTAEIKLHDDAGDIEVWLMQGGYDGQPWRILSRTTLTLSFPELGKKIELAVRDHIQNKDESGSATLVDGKTNYFVFPGASGMDPAWLMGGNFAAKAELSFLINTTGPFVLRPHVHR